ncbi:hypothetical protein CDAR_91951 [Caerostris darwini]|uniref:Uncharacterized protein n=1 Tax=Caerostris darwini TaxID=1538125 RepID=A0AAV4QMD8_9ARAC|nr:hypothetical protein CDAR_91951 [Caerostris darwini]
MKEFELCHRTPKWPLFASFQTKVSYGAIITSSGSVAHCFAMVIGQSVFTLTSSPTPTLWPAAPRGKCYDSSNAEIGSAEFRYTHYGIPRSDKCPKNKGAIQSFPENRKRTGRVLPSGSVASAVTEKVDFYPLVALHTHLESNPDLNESESRCPWRSVGPAVLVRACVNTRHCHAVDGRGLGSAIFAQTTQFLQSASPAIKTSGSLLFRLIRFENISSLHTGIQGGIKIGRLNSTAIDEPESVEVLARQKFRILRHLASITIPPRKKKEKILQQTKNIEKREGEVFSTGVVIGGNLFQPCFPPQQPTSLPIRSNLLLSILQEKCSILVSCLSFPASAFQIPLSFSRMVENLSQSIQDAFNNS